MNLIDAITALNERKARETKAFFRIDFTYSSSGGIARWVIMYFLASNTNPTICAGDTLEAAFNLLLANLDQKKTPAAEAITQASEMLAAVDQSQEPIASPLEIQPA